MSAFHRTAILLGFLVAFLAMPKAQAPGFPRQPKYNQETALLHYIHGYHCDRRYSSALGWHRDRGACAGL